MGIIPENKSNCNTLERTKKMVIKIGNREVQIERTDNRITTLKISRIDADNRVLNYEVVNMDKAETAALIAALNVEKPKG